MANNKSLSVDNCFSLKHPIFFLLSLNNDQMKFDNQMKTYFLKAITEDRRCLTDLFQENTATLT